MNSKSLLFKLTGIFVLGVITAVLAFCVFSIEKIQGDVMEPQIKDGEHVLVNKQAYLYREPEAGDVIAFRCDVYSEDCEGSLIVRRVAAVEGDSVEISEGTLYVNGEKYQGYSEQQVYLDDLKPVTVGQNRVFVLADSQLAVLDSRDSAVGQLRYDEIEGKVCFK